MNELEYSGFIVQGDHDFILVNGTHKKRAHGKLKVSDKAKDYYRVGVLKSDMHTAVLKEINSTCECFSKEVILEEFARLKETWRKTLANLDKHLAEDKF